MNPSQPEPRPHITVCVLTCNRLAWLKRLLDALEDQKTNGQFTYSARVVDNDPAQSARAVVQERPPASKVKVEYDFEPQKNLAVARNRAAIHAAGDFVTFIDDDEFPVPEWLWELFNTCRTCQADGVLGPVRPHFESTPPSWLVRSGVCNRPAHPTGLVLDYNQTRTGNVLLSHRIFDNPENHFNPEFATHGEDRDFFKRAIGRGYKFVWCEEAAAYETVPESRWLRRYYIRRALLRGSVSWRNTRDRARELVKTIAAIIIYTLSLPFLLLGGQGLFMKYFLKNCDHVGRMLAVCGLPVEKFMKTP